MQIESSKVVIHFLLLKYPLLATGVAYDSERQRINYKFSIRLSPINRTGGPHWQQWCLEMPCLISLKTALSSLEDL